MTEQRRRTRRNDLTLDEVVEAAIGLLDEGGIEAFSMRALAQRLRRGTMTAYSHVESREALICLAADAVQTDLPDVDHLPWYERLEAYARHGWETTWSVHPWVVEYIDRGGASEQAQQKLVAMAKVFRDAGFDDDDVRRALVAHWSFVVGTLRLMLDTRAAAGTQRDPDEAVFDFNLRTWILGLIAKARDYEPAALDAGPGRDTPKSSKARRPSRQR